MSTTLTDSGQLACGTLSSSAMLLSLQPVFNLKTAAMSNNPAHPLRQFFREMLAYAQTARLAEGAKFPYAQVRAIPIELYRGMLPNLAAVAPAQAASFWGFATALRSLAEDPSNPYAGEKSKAALVGGCAAALPANVFERLMIAQQVNKLTLREAVVAKGFMRGLPMTTLREILFTSALFGAGDTLSSQVAWGAGAGALSALPDTVKTVQQGELHTKTSAYQVTKSLLTNPARRIDFLVGAGIRSGLVASAIVTMNLYRQHIPKYLPQSFHQSETT